MSKIILAEQSSAPDTPGSGKSVIYVNANGELSVKDDAGNVKTLGRSSALIDETTDPVAGDYLWLIDASAPAGNKDRRLDWSHVANMGTWTPELRINNNVTGITYSARTGSYARIADKIGVVAFDVSLSSKGALTGAVTIAGVPFAPVVSAPVIPSYWAGTNLAGATLNGRVDAGGTTIILTKVSGNATTQIQDTDITNGTRIIGLVLMLL